MPAPTPSSPHYYYLPPSRFVNMSAVEAIAAAQRIVDIWTPDAGYSTPDSFDSGGLRDNVNFPTAPADQPADWAKAVALWQQRLGRLRGTGDFGGGNAKGLVWLGAFAQSLSQARDRSLWMNGIPGAEAVYALRRLVPGYAGPLLRVRRSTDDTEADIGATGGGDLNIEALLDFCGGGHGLVRWWYEQTGHARHLGQAIASRQPRIVTAGVPEKFGPENAVGIRFDGGDDFLSTAPFSVPAPWSWFFAYNLLSHNLGRAASLLHGDPSSAYPVLMTTGGVLKYFGDGGSVVDDVDTPPVVATNRQMTVMARSGSGTNSVRINGAATTFDVGETSNAAPMTGLCLGADSNVPDRAAHIAVRELIVLSNQPSTANRDRTERKMSSGWSFSDVEAKDHTNPTTASLLMNYGDRAGSGFFRSMVPFAAVGGPIVASAAQAFGAALPTKCLELNVCTPSVGDCDNEDHHTLQHPSVAQWRDDYQADARYATEVIIDDGVTTQTGQQWAAANGNPDLTSGSPTGAHGLTGSEYAQWLLMETSVTAIRKFIRDPIAAEVPTLRWKNFGHCAASLANPQIGGGGAPTIVNTKSHLDLDSPVFYGVDLARHQLPGESAPECWLRVQRQNLASWVAEKGARSGIPWLPWPNAVKTPPGEYWPDVLRLGLFLIDLREAGVAEIQFWSDPEQANPDELAQAMLMALTSQEPAPPSVVVPTRPLVTGVATAAIAADANGHRIENPTGQLLLRVSNAGGAPVDVTIPVRIQWRPREGIWPLMRVPDQVITVPTGATKLIGPIPAAYVDFRGYTTLTYSSTSGVTIEAIRPR